jgi:hypothetical protein
MLRIGEHFINIMTQTLLIHCGMAKAGSSTLQEEMSILASRHKNLFSFRHIHPETCDLLEAKNEEPLLEFRKLFANCFKNGKSCMLSQEYLSHKREAVTTLVTLASGYFDRVEVFFLVRDPGASIQSAYLQWGFRNGRVGNRINQLIKNQGDTESAIMMSSKEWFSILLLRDAIDKRFILYSDLLDPAKRLKDFAEGLYDGGSRFSALSLDDSPRDQSLLGSCIERLGVQDSFGAYIPRKPVMANRSFNPFAVEIIAREIDTNLFREHSLISLHQNALITEYSSLLDKKVGSALEFDNDGLAASLSEMVSVAIRPLRNDINGDFTRGVWSRFNQPPSMSGLPSWDNIQKLYKDTLNSRLKILGSTHKLQLQQAGELYENLSDSSLD